MTKELTPIVLMKIEAKMAVEEFRKRYKKATKGIEKIYSDMVLSNDFNFVKKSRARLFGYIMKSKKAKEKWKE